MSAHGPEQAAPRPFPEIAVIIPHWRRNEDLERCLISIHQSSELTGRPVRIIVVDSDEPCFGNYGVEWVPVQETYPYCKSLSQNAGWSKALEYKPDVIAVLDCDMVVGPLWLDACACARRSRVTRVCFDVRDFDGDPRDVEWSLDTWAASHRRWMGWDNPWCNAASKSRTSSRRQPLCFGNSCWATAPSVVGPIRWDERMLGRGWEDLDFTCRLVLHVGWPFWRGLLFKKPQYNLYHIKHDPLEWATDNRDNRRRALSLFRASMTKAEDQRFFG